MAMGPWLLEWVPGADERLYTVGGAICECCGALSPEQFHGGPVDGFTWPMECTERFVREPLTHPECGGRIMLEAPALSSRPRG